MNATPGIKDLLGCCIAAARGAGEHALSNEARRAEIVKKSSHDVKLALDIECQAKAEEVIRATYPSHLILGEEGGAFSDSKDPMWIIDPIDGTVNFMHGLPLWCSSVAVRVGGEVVAGAVYMPALQELFTATCEEPSTLNGKPIKVSRVARVGDAVVLTGLSKHVGKDRQTLSTFEAISFKAQKTRLMGAAAVDICNVACGRADGYFESTIQLWDVAAAALIVKQAGGRSEVLEQLDPIRMRVLCSNGLIHDELKGIIAAALAATREA
jgi:myo-inositol-1(or 4)-monophosphatase